MPMVVHPDYIAKFRGADYTVQSDIEYAYEHDKEPPPPMSALETSLHEYNYLVDNGVPIYEARQVLPGAAAVNLIWTVNARSLVNFFTQRLCYRNVDEMQIFAERILERVTSWWPEFGGLMGPHCYTHGECNQGRMSCGQKYTRSV